MNVFLWILTVLGILVAVVILLILYLIFGRIHLVADYRKSEIKLWLQFLFLKYEIYPDPEKKEQKEAEKYASSQTEQSEEKQKPQTSSPSEGAKKAAEQPYPPQKRSPVGRKKKKTIRSAAKKEIRKALHSVGFKDYATLLQVIVVKFIAKFRCEKLTLYASIGGEDAMSVATDYGTLNALLYPVLGAFSAAGKLKKCDVQITPDFTSEEIHGEGRAVFSFRLFQAFACIWELSEKLY